MQRNVDLVNPGMSPAKQGATHGGTREQPAQIDGCG